MPKKNKGGRPRMYDRPPKILAVPLPAPIHNAIHREAERRGISASALVRKSLVEMPMFAPTRIKKKQVRQLIK